jgi:hypothetical protein
MPKKVNSFYFGEDGKKNEINLEHDSHVKELKASKALKKAGGTEFRQITWYKATPELILLYGASKLNDCVEVFTKSHREFVVLDGNFKGERFYYDFFADMIKNRKLWFRLFEIDENHILAECSVGMLGTLATIYRQRGELKKATDVMELDECVLIRYEDMISRLSVADPGLLPCCHDLRFKYNHIRMNLLVGQHLESPNIATFAAAVPSVLRDLIRHEIQKKFTYEEQNYAFMVEEHTHRDPSLADLAKMTDRDVLKICLLWMEMNDDMGFLDPTKVTGKDLRKVSLQQCVQCKKVEEMRGDFQCCGSCKKVHYCTQDCQKLHWKDHKAICKLSK